MQHDTPTTKTLTLERTFHATPRELWDAWTEPEQYAKWLNPAPGHDLVIHEWDLRPGGKVRFDMPQPNGDLNPQTGVFHELEPEKRLVTGEPDKSFLLEATFEPVDDRRTRLVVNVTGIPPEYREPAIIGWNQCFDKLAGVLGRMQSDVVLVRTINAPRERVWQAWTDGDLLKQWYGPKGFTIPTVESDARVGGTYRYLMRSPDGQEFWGAGVYKELDSPERLVRTEAMTDPQGNVITNEEMPETTVSVTLEELDGKTRMTLRHSGLTKRGMEGATMGWHGAIEKLEKTVNEA